MAAPNRTLAGLLDRLAPFRPLVAGTYPLGLHVEGSDIDVLCEVSAPAALESFVRAHPDWFANATVESADDVTPPACVVRLRLDGLAIEIFGQAVPVHRQVAFRHMIVEGRLLSLGGPALADRVRALKASGVKTEPAFARALGLTGDPYATLLDLEEATTDELRALVDAIHREPRL